METGFTTLSQLVSAVRLARGFGHAWADVVCEAEWLEAAGLDLPAGAVLVEDLVGLPWAEAERKIRALVVDLCPEWPGLYPEWDEEGDIVHRTQTGRLSWLVDAEGHVRVNVWRPGPTAAGQATFAGTVRVLADGSVEDLRVEPCCRLRHLDALRDAITALGAPGSAVEPVLRTVAEAEARELYPTTARIRFELYEAAAMARRLADALPDDTQLAREATALEAAVEAWG